jgi:hypothetical protein
MPGTFRIEYTTALLTLIPLGGPSTEYTTALLTFMPVAIYVMSRIANLIEVHPVMLSLRHRR